MTSVLTPALVLIVWSLLVWIWMYLTRIPAMQAAGIDPQKARFPGSLNVLPDRVRGVADNYNHLMEQPTIFYALVFYCYLSGGNDTLNIWCAWAYAVLRVVHSLVQGTANNVTQRFGLFALSTVALMLIAGHEVWRLLSSTAPAG